MEVEDEDGEGRLTLNREGRLGMLLMGRGVAPPPPCSL